LPKVTPQVPAVDNSSFLIFVEMKSVGGFDALNRRPSGLNPYRYLQYAAVGLVCDGQILGR
jgi:hypothetical protein